MPRKAGKALSPLSAGELERLQGRAGEAAALLKALSNEKRLLILCTLAGGERSVSELNERIAMSQSAMSQQLAVLRREGLVETRRDAQTIYYSLAPSNASAIIEVLRRLYCGRESSGRESSGRESSGRESSGRESSGRRASGRPSSARRR